MTRLEHLLTILTEECAEVTQRASKALRFGLQEIEPGQEQTNAERMLAEHMDLLSVMDMVMEEAGLKFNFKGNPIQEKRDKVEKYLAYSEECGTLNK